MGTALLAAWSRISGQLEHLDFAAQQVDLARSNLLVPKISRYVNSDTQGVEVLTWQVSRLTEYLHRGEDNDGLLHHGCKIVHNIWMSYHNWLIMSFCENRKHSTFREKKIVILEIS